VIGTGSSAFVDGSQYLTTGSYQYYCSVHPFMQGTLTVTSAGKPATPPPGSDRHAPAIAVEIVSGKLGGVQSSGKLKVSFHTDEAASVDLHGSVQVGQHTYVLGKASRTEQGNRPTSVSLTLSSKARQAVQKASKAVFKVGARTRDAAGNRGSGAAKRTLRR
jgi:hypothetical protein